MSTATREAARNLLRSLPGWRTVPPTTAEVDFVARAIQDYCDGRIGEHGQAPIQPVTDPQKILAYLPKLDYLTARRYLRGCLRLARKQGREYQRSLT